jgi:hypothetical protein
MNEVVFIGGRAAALGEPVRFRGRPVFLGYVQPIGVGDDSVWPSDLLAYRKQWDPFIAAHVALWRHLNDIFEATAAGQSCPLGMNPDDLAPLDPTMRAFCASLMITRMRIDDTNAGRGIPAAWNAFAGKSASEILSGAAPMLKWFQDTVHRVAGTYKDEMLKIAKMWNIEIVLPDMPTLSTQQSIIATIEGAYTTAKGILQLVGYAIGTEAKWVGTQAQGIVEGLTDTVKALPKVVGGLSSPWTWVGVAAILAVVGAGLVIYYVPAPRKSS